MKYIIVYLFITLSIYAKAQKDTARLENYIRLNYENDFFTATDRYYTQGIQLSIIHPIFKYSPISKTLIKLKNSSSNYYGITIEQDCFTPRSIRHNGIFYDERPFTGVFFLSHQLTSQNFEKQIALKTQLDIGGIGKCARCEDEQKAIHRALINIQPLGWENQLNNDVVVNYKAGIEKGIINRKHVQSFVQSTVRMGTLYDDLSAGVNFRFGIFSNYFKNLGLEKTYINNPAKKFKAYIVLKSNLRTVGYNATLQGGVFRHDNIYTLKSNQITRLVYDAGGYAVLAFKHFSVEYGYFYTTKEFEAGLEHGWGKVTFISNF